MTPVPAVVRRQHGLGSALLLGLLLLNGLGAYSLFGIPIQWMGNLAALVLGGSLLLLRYRTLVPGSGPLIALLLYTALVNVVVLLSDGYGRTMPPLATTSYVPFVALRFVTLIVFLVAASFTFYQASRGYCTLLVDGMVSLGVVLSLFALYVYVAQIYGLPEPPRSRMGTSGGEQAVRFSYQFHRAIGSFREPSHLAEWLIAPFYLSLLRRGRWAWLASTLIAFAMVLTGSLTGLASIALGFLAALLWLQSPRQLLRMAWSYALPLTGAVVLFSALAVSYDDSAANLAGTLWSRIEPILETGSFQATNRASVYTYLGNNPPAFFGRGLGNSNLEYAASVGSPAVTSFLSLYWNALYSCGYPGLVLMVWFLSRPLLRRGAFRQMSGRARLLLTAAYISYLVAFGVHTEEPPIQFALLFGLVAYYQSRGVNYHAAARSLHFGVAPSRPRADGLLPARP